MSRARRVGGSGWAGVHGSFVGLSKGSAGGKANVRVGSKTKKKPILAKIDLASLPDIEQVQRAAKRVLAVQTDIEAAKNRLQLLQGQLAVLMDELKAAQNLTKPIKPRQSSAKPKAKKGQGGPKPAKKPKPSAAGRISDKKARENFRNAPKEVEVEHRVAGVIVSKRTVERS